MTVRLVLETTTPVAGVALMRDDAVVAHVEIETRSATSEMLIGLVDEGFARTSITPQDLAEIGVDRGPGAFTGVRVGLATAIGLARGWECPLRSVTAIEVARTAAAGHPGPVLVALDARRGQLYARWFASGGEAVGDIVALPPELLPDPPDEATPLIVGSGLRAFPSELASRFPRAVFGEPDAVRAPAVARVLDAAGGSDDVEPLYVRPPDARLPGSR